MTAPLLTIPDWVYASPLSFIFGLLAGFVLSNRFRIVKRDKE